MKFDQNPDKEECVRKKYACLETLGKIFDEKRILQLEEMAEDVLTIWAIYEQASPSGLFLEDAPAIAHLLLRVSINFNRISYGTYFLTLISSHIATGIRIRKASDLLPENLKTLSYALTIIAEAVCAGEVVAQVKILTFVNAWLKQALGKVVCDTRKTSYCDEEKFSYDTKTKALPGHAFVEALLRSLLPKLLGNYVKDGGYTGNESYALFLQVLRKCVLASEEIRKRFSEMPFLDPLLFKLCLDDDGDILLRMTLDLIFALCGSPLLNKNKGRVIGDSIVSPSEGGFQFLLTRLFQVMGKTFSTAGVSLRNDTAFLVGLIAHEISGVATNCSSQYVEGVAAVVAANIFGRMEGANMLDTSLIMEPTPADAELLQYLIWAIGGVLKNGASLHIIEEYQLAPALIAVLMGPSRLVKAMGEVTDVNGLESAAWNTLMIIAENKPTAFLTTQGVPAILDYLKVFNQPDTFTDSRVLQMFAHLLRKVLFHGVTEAGLETRAFFAEREALPVIVTAVERIRLNYAHSKKVGGLQQWTDESVLWNLLFSCGLQGMLGMEEKEQFRDSEGVKTLIKVIRQVITHPSQEKNVHPILHVAIADCALHCIADSPSNLEIFLAKEGLLWLLDLLEVAAGPPASIHILTAILELCEYSRCMDQVLEWRRNTNNNANEYVEGDEDKYQEDTSLTALLCDIWREEERQWGVLRDSEGCIASIDYPLMGEYGRGYSRSAIVPEVRNHPGPSILDLVGSVRPKIAFLTTKVIDAVNTEAVLFTGLSLRNQLTTQIMVNFMDLKAAELWREVGRELEEEGITLLLSDRKALRILTTIAKNKVIAMISTQRYLIERADEIEEMAEEELYKEIRQDHLLNHVTAMTEAGYVPTITRDVFPQMMERIYDKAHKTVPATPQGTPNTTGPFLRIGDWPPPTHGTLLLLPKSQQELANLSPSYSIIIPKEDPDVRSHNPSPTFNDDSGAGATPLSEDGTAYMVSSEALKKALVALQSKLNKHKWSHDEENFWQYRMKWKKDWYPVEKVPGVSLAEMKKRDELLLRELQLSKITITSHHH